MASLAFKCAAALSLSLLMSFSVDSQKTGVIFGDVTTSEPDIVNWGKGRAALNVIHFDSSACAGATCIKSECQEVSSWHRRYLVELHT